MEIVLQWLDELDDLVFAGFSLWRRVSRLCLSIAATASLALLLTIVVDRPPLQALPLAGLAAAALSTWMLFALLAKSAANSRHSMARNA